MVSIHNIRICVKQEEIMQPFGVRHIAGSAEISPKEFAQFIGKEMRLSKVEYAPKVE